MKTYPGGKLQLEMPGTKDLAIPHKRILVPPGRTIRLARDYDPGYTAKFKDKEAAQKRLGANIQEMAQLQDRLYAQNSHALLIVIQALDAAGKDGLIKHVMSGVNPQGCQVVSFKTPSTEELDHDFLWRISKALPPRGKIGIFNRSYYEEVLVVRVHPEFLDKQNLPKASRGEGLWRRRFEAINHFEQYLVANGVVVLKFFLNVSAAEQRRRFLERIEHRDKNWKFSAADFHEHSFWRQYQQAYEEMLNHTSTPWAPWYVIPADHKWFTRLAASELIVRTLRSLKLEYPRLGREQQRELRKIKAALKKEETR